MAINATKLGETVNSTLDPLGKIIFGNTGAPDISQATPATIIGNLVAYLFGFLGVIFLVLAIYGGILWMTAQGNEEQSTKARKIITQAIVGLLITLAVGSLYVLIRVLLGVVGVAAPV